MLLLRLEKEAPLRDSTLVWLWLWVSEEEEPEGESEWPSDAAEECCERTLRSACSIACSRRSVEAMYGLMARKLQLRSCSAWSASVPRKGQPATRIAQCTRLHSRRWASKSFFRNQNDDDDDVVVVVVVDDEFDDDEFDDDESIGKVS